jgi:hypothetical protein
MSKTDKHFYKNTVNTTGLDYWCKSCRKNYQKQRFQTVKTLEASKRRIRYRQDIQFRLGVLLRSRISNLFKTGSAVSDLGCSLSELKRHLEDLWKPGMTWDNYGLHGWHIDHIIPISRVDLTDPEQFRKVCHFTNLQPLWSSDNLSKGNKI